MMEEDPYYEVFLQFLDTKGVRENYHHNCANHRMEGIAPEDASDLLDACFDWSETVEGYDFWANLHIAWVTLLEEAGYDGLDPRPVSF